MKTNYKLLTMFEVATVFMAVAGFVLIGVMLFANLTPRTQTKVTSSFDILDMNQTAAQANQVVGFVFDSTDEFYKQFYVAFTQIATLPPEIFETPVRIASNFYEAFGNFSDQVGLDYRLQNQSNEQIAFDGGKVLGVLIDLGRKNNPPDCNPLAKMQDRYNYQPPDINQIIKNLKVEEIISKQYETK